MNKELVIDVSGQNIPELYEDWAWLIKPSDAIRPVIMSLFGNLFYEKHSGLFKKSSTIWLLDIVAGTNAKFADSRAELDVKLSDPDIQKKFLYGGLISDLITAGLVVSADTIYSFKVPPHLGGTFTIDNIEVADRSVAISLTGQIWNQTKDLAPGTVVNGVGVVQPIDKS